jgi:hypothetical protein
MAERATPLPELLEPLDLDALTIPDDNRFLDLLARERNLPAGLAAKIQQCY